MNTNETNKSNAVTASLQNSSPFDQLVKLHAEQNVWSDTLYKTSTNQLYSMLAGCLDVCEQLKGERKQRKQLDHWMTTAGLKFNEGTSLETKIVRYVFRIDGKRSQIYSRVIRIAITEGIKSVGFVTWVIEHGGLEEVRRKHANGISAADVKKQIVSSAADILLGADAIATLEQASLLTVNTDGSLEFCLALVRENKVSGKPEIVYGVNNAALIKKFIAFVGKDVIGESTAKLAVSQQKAAATASADAIDAIVAKQNETTSAIAA